MVSRLRVFDPKFIPSEVEGLDTNEWGWLARAGQASPAASISALARASAGALSPQRRNWKAG